jgi:RNA-directed DNA polymerase
VPAHPPEHGRYPNRKLLIKPSQAAIRRVRERLASELRTLRGGNATAVIARLNPIIRGWAAYYRGVVSSRQFGSLDHYLWHITCKWATWRHENKPKRWIVGRYFGKFNTFRNDHWVFGDRDSGAYMVRFSWTAIEWHVPVRGSASPDDPALASYWAERRKKMKTPARQVQPAPAIQAGRALPALRGPPALRRSATPVSRAVGTVVAARHPQGDSRQLSHPRQTRPSRR